MQTASRLWMALIFAGLFVTLVACNDNQLAPSPEEVGRGGISGRVCGPDGTNWLAEARVYVPIYSTSGDLVMEPETLTDLDGYFTLMEVPAGTWMLHVQKNSFSTEIDITVSPGEVTVIPEPTCIDPYSANVAVVTGLYDHVEGVLTRVGLTNVTMYDGVNSQAPSARDLLGSLTTMVEYDIIFLNCGMVETGLINDPTIIQNLRGFVESGGSLYASDWAYDYIEITWPSAIEFYRNDATVDDAAWGLDGMLSATVNDASLQNFLGQGQVSLNYDLGAWVVTEGASASTRVLVSGSPQALDPTNPFIPEIVTVPNSPLMIMFEAGEGKVMYTTFHNESQTTQDMDIILEFMVFEL